MSDYDGGDYHYPSGGGSGSSSYGGGGGGGGDHYRPPSSGGGDSGGIWALVVVGFVVLSLFAACQEDQETATPVDEPVVQQEDPAPVQQWQQEIDRMERDLAPPPPVPAPEDWQ